jgi:hypothetical protein
MFRPPLGSLFRLPLAILLLSASASSLLAANPLRGEARPGPTGPFEGGKSSDAYTIAGGIWRTDGDFVSTIRIKNALVNAPLDVQPVLYMSDGTPYPLPSVTVPSGGVATVNVNEAVAQASASIAGHVSKFGSAALVYQYPTAGHLFASILLLDIPHSLTFVYPLSPAMEHGPSSSSNTLEGVWWKHDLGITGFLGLSNVTAHEVRGSVQLIGPHGELEPDRPFDVSEHSTTIIDLNKLGVSFSGAHASAGGIRVQYDGIPGSIQEAGGLMNETEGYSAKILFWSHNPSSSAPLAINFGFAGLVVGKPAPMMMFPAGTIFSTYLTLRNTSAVPIKVSQLVNYMSESNPVSAALPTQVLDPFESKQVDLEPGLSALGLRNFSGNLNLELSYDGRPGDLLVSAGSVDQTGTYVLEVDPQGIGATHRRIGSYWSTANGNDTKFSLWNPTNEVQDVTVTFYYGDGSGNYAMPVHLDPQGSTTIDLKNLTDQKIPDANGTVIPPSEQQGSASFISSEPSKLMTLVIGGGTLNVTTATCGYICIRCCAFDSFSLSPSSPGIAVGNNSQLEAEATDCSGAQGAVTVASWSSSNSGIATVSSATYSSASVTGVALGSTTITAQLGSLESQTTAECKYDAEPLPCPIFAPIITTPANVTLKVTGNAYDSIFVGSDPGLQTANTFVADVSPDNGTLTVTSSDTKDSFTYGSLTAGALTAVIKTPDQSTSIGDRTLTFTYAASGYNPATQSVKVTSRQFAYATNLPPANTCQGFGTSFQYVYTPFTHPDKAAVQAGIGVQGTVVMESFSPAPPPEAQIGNGNLTANSEFVDTIAYCSNTALTLSASVTQKISIEGYQVRQNLLTYSSSGVILTNQGPTQ